MEENILLSIGIDQKQVEEAISAAAEARREIDKLRLANKELSKAEGDNSVAITKNNITIKENSKSLRENERVVIANNKIQSQSSGTIEKLRAELSLVSQQWAKVTDAEGANSEESKKLGKRKLELTEILKKEEKATGDTRRNVGNYTDSIKEAVGATGSFGQGLVGMVSGLRAATVASLKFLATPLGAAIGAVALVIGSVVGLFKLFTASLNRSEEGSAALASVMNVFKGILGGVLSALEPVATFLVEGVAKGFEILGAVVEKVSKQVQNALSFFGFDKASVALGVLTEKIKETSIATAQLAKAEAELNGIRRQQGKLQLEFQTQAEKLRQLRDDESKSMPDRIKANKDLGALLKDQAESELLLAQRALEISELRIKAEGDSTANLDKKAEAELKILEIQERVNSQRSEQLTNENSLIREQTQIIQQETDKRTAIAKEAFEKRRDDQLDALISFEEMDIEFEEAKEQRMLVTADREINDLKERYANGLISKQEYEDSLTEIEAGAIAIRMINAQLAIDDANNDLTISEAERVAIIQSAEDEIQGIRASSLDAQLKSNQMASDALDAQNSAVAQGKVDLANFAVNFAIESLGRETAAGKIFAGIQAFINTATAVSQALPNIPLAVLTGISGAVQIAKIASTNVPPAQAQTGTSRVPSTGGRQTGRRSFADGGHTGNGYGYSDETGFRQAGIVHENEYVVPKWQVQSPKFSGLIGSLESSRLKGYADGGFVGRSASGANAGFDINAIISAIENMPSPVVSVIDIQAKANSRNKVRVESRLQ